MAADRSGVFPSVLQELLLKAALSEGQPMLDAWEAWRSQVDFERDVDYGSQRLLPLLFHNLHRHAIDDPVLLRMKGMYRKAWSNNQILFHLAGQTLQSLHEQGIPVMVLKGIPLSLMVYKNPAVRPMADIDLMVPRAQMDSAVDILLRHGWALQEPHRKDFFISYGRSLSFVNPQDKELDLHWCPVFERHDRMLEHDFWDRVVPLEVSGVHALAMCPADSLFHTIIHGLRRNNEPPIRWVPDAVCIIRQQNQQIDWERLLHYTRQFEVSAQIKAAFHYLTQTFDVPVPATALQKINALKPGIRERVVFWHAMHRGDTRPAGIRQKAVTIFVNYMRQTSHNNMLKLFFGFWAYLYMLTKGRPPGDIIKKNLLLLRKKPEV